MGSFKVQGQCVISTYERMRQKDCKFEDNRGQIETAVFIHASGSHSWHAWACSHVVSVDGAVFLLVTSYLADTGPSGHFDKSQAS